MSLPDGLQVHVPTKGYAVVVTRTGNELLQIKPVSAEGRANYLTLLTDIFDEIVIEGYGRRVKE